MEPPSKPSTFGSKHNTEEKEEPIADWPSVMPVGDLAKEPSKVLPCLLEIYQFGLSRSPNLWLYKDRPVPTQGKWALDVLREVDPPTALGLYREVVKASPLGSEERIRAQIQVAKLKGIEPLEELNTILKEATLADTPARRGLALEIAGVFAELDYVEGASAVKHLAGLLPDKDHLVSIYSAQLGLEIGLLEAMARKNGSAPHAVRALLRIGRRDIVEALATDPKNPFEETARELLKQSLPGP